MISHIYELWVDKVEDEGKMVVIMSGMNVQIWINIHLLLFIISIKLIKQYIRYAMMQKG